MALPHVEFAPIAVSGFLALIDDIAKGKKLLIGNEISSISPFDSGQIGDECVEFLAVVSFDLFLRVVA